MAYAQALVRLLLLADTHLGFDLPLRPRVDRPRRGPHFLRCFEAALAPALRGEVDLVIHGGDLLYRCKVPDGLLPLAMAPLLAVARAGVPIVVVPGNHECGRLPLPLTERHPLLHVLGRPSTLCFEVAGARVAVSGFPFVRRDVRGRLPALLTATGWEHHEADVRLLCLHQTVEGARVAGYTFRDAPDIIPGRSLPDGFAAVLCGHIHRHQVLTRDLGGRRLAAPVLYPGSTERTSVAERDERKGYLIVEVGAGDRPGGRLLGARFEPLPTGPLPERRAWASNVRGRSATPRRRSRR